MKYEKTIERNKTTMITFNLQGMKLFYSPHMILCNGISNDISYYAGKICTKRRVTASTTTTVTTSEYRCEVLRTLHEIHHFFTQNFPRDLKTLTLEHFFSTQIHAANSLVGIMPWVAKAW